MRIVLITYLFLTVLNGFSGNIDTYKNNPKNPYYGYSEALDKRFVFWHLNSISGEIGAKAFYSQYDREINSFNDAMHGSRISGGLTINTSSYFVHPKFLLVDISAEYSPENNLENYQVMPDQAENISVKRLSIQTTFFNQKKVIISPFASWDESYQKRENITNIKSDNKQIGARLISSYNWLPLTVYYSQRNWVQKEIGANRSMTLDENLFRASLVKSFFKLNRNELNYSHNKYRNVNVNAHVVNNTIDELNLNNDLFFDSNRKYHFNSNISYLNNLGYMDYNRLQAFENLTLKLPYHLTLNGNYNFHNFSNARYDLKQNSIVGSIGHKLYKSLNTKLFAEQNYITHTLYKEFNYKGGGDINYSKEIPKGKLNLYYKYYKYHQEMNSESSNIFITNEEAFIDDSKLVLLQKPYINQSTIIVKDATGTIIYQIDVDYILVERNNFIEIKRIPGGLIANSTSVYIDYMAIQPGNYNFDANCHFFNANVLLFDNKLELYYRMASQDYFNINRADFLTLNYFTQNVVGAKIDLGFVNFGADYDSYESSIMPYTMKHYFINFQRNFQNRFSFILNGNRQEYNLINENTNQLFQDIVGKFGYQISKQTNLNIGGMYRNQVDDSGIDLNLVTGTFDLTTSYRQIYVSIRAELYRRSFITNKNNFDNKQKESVFFKGGFISISRRF